MALRTLTQGPILSSSLSVPAPTITGNATIRPASGPAKTVTQGGSGVVGLPAGVPDTLAPTPLPVSSINPLLVPPAGVTPATINPQAPAAGIDPTTAALLTAIGALGQAQGGGANSAPAANTLPPPSAADVAALQPTPSNVSSSGPNIVLVVAAVAALGFGVWWFVQHRHGG
jgi:hypothetical protein